MSKTGRKQKTCLLRKLKGACKIPKVLILQIRASYAAYLYDMARSKNNPDKEIAALSNWGSSVLRTKIFADDMSRDFGFKDMDDFYNHLTRKKP